MADIISSVDGILNVYDDGTIDIVGGSLHIDGTEVLAGNNAAVFTSLSVDSPTLVVDAVNNRVGIGSATPSNLLHLAASSGNSILELQRTNTNTTGTVGAISFTASDGHSVSSIYSSGDGDNEGAHLIFATTSAASDNSYFTSTTERMRITSGGNVNITNDLTVGGNLTVEGTTTTLNTATLDVEDLNITIAKNAANAAAADGAGLTVDGANATLLYKSTADAWSFNKAVGIGTISLSSKLHVYDSTSTSASATGSTLLTLDNYVGSDLSQQKTFIDFRLFDDNSNETPQVRIGAEVGANGDANTQILEGEGAFVVYTNDTGGTSGTATGLTEKFRVDSPGNVGIGTNAPDTKLELYHGVFKIQGDNNSNDAIYIGNDDNISHGGTAGSGPYPSIYAENVLRVRQRIQIFDDNGAANELDIRDTSGTRRWYLRPTADSYFTGGNLGIGTDNPTARLDVKVDTAGNLLSRVWNSNTSGTGISSVRIANSGNNAQGSRLEFSDTAYYVATVTGDRTNGMQFYTGQMANPTTNLRMTLGIDGALSYHSPDGTNTIVQRMTDADVLSWSGDSGQLFSISDNLTGTIFSVNDVSGVPSIEVDDDGTIRLAEVFGNVLIGTGSDDGVSKLQLDGSLDIFKSNSESVTNYATTSHLILDNDSDQTKILFKANSANKGGIRVDSSGNMVFTAGSTIYYFNYDSGAGGASTSGEFRYYSGSSFLSWNSTAVTLPGNTSIGGTLDVTQILGNVGINTGVPGAPLHVYGAGGDGQEVLRIESSADVPDGGYHWMTSAIAGSQTTNANIVHLIGQAESTKNSGYLGFHYAGAASNNNYISLGGYGANHLLNVMMDGRVGIGTSSPDAVMLTIRGNATRPDPSVRLIPGNATSDVRIDFRTNANATAYYFGWDQSTGEMKLADSGGFSDPNMTWGSHTVHVDGKFQIDNGTNYNGLGSKFSGSATMEVYRQDVDTAGIVIGSSTGVGHTWLPYVDGTIYLTGDASDTAGHIILRSFNGTNYTEGAALDKSGTFFETRNGAYFKGHIANTSGSGDNNAPFRFSTDFSGWMNIVAGTPGSANGWGLFWAGNSGAAYGTNQATYGPGNIWTNSTNPNEFVIVGGGRSGASFQPYEGNAWIKTDLWVGDTKVKLQNTEEEVDVTSPNLTSGTWVDSTSATNWGPPKFDNVYNNSAYNDAPGYRQWNIPSGMKSAYISHLTWNTGGYVDVHGVQADGDLVFLRRINTKQAVENANHADPGAHDGSTITFAGSGLENFTAIRFTNQFGRFHLTGLSFTRNSHEGTEGTGMVHPAQFSQTIDITLTGDTTGTGTVNANGDVTISTTTGSIDGQQFVNTRSNSGRAANSTDGNGIYYYTSDVDNFTGNSTDGAMYQQSYSSLWYHQIAGDYRSGNIALRGKNNNNWQRWKKVPTIYTSDSAPTTALVNDDFWFDSDEGKLKIRYAGTWVDTFTLGTSNFVQKSGDTMTGNLNVQGNIVATGDVTAYGTVSDIRQKENIVKLDNAIEKVGQLNGYTFNYKGHTERLTGVIAQEVEKVLPEAVYETQSVDLDETIMAVRHGNMVGLLIEAMKEQQEQINMLKAEIEKLKGE